MKRFFNQYFIALYLCLIGHGFCVAQSVDTVTTGYHPAYIAKYPKSLAVTPFLLVRNFSVEFSSNRDSTYAVEYAPNLAPQWGIGIDYRWLTLAFTTSLGLEGADFKDKGPTSKVGFTGGLTRQKWMAVGGFQYFKGFYLNPPEDADKPLHYDQRQDIQVFTANLSWSYLLNHKKYSHPAALYVTTERQLKSAGSVVFGAQFRTFHISADSSLIPQRIAAHYDSANLVKKNGYYLLVSNLGYAYTLVLKKKFFANGGLALGLGPVFSSYTPVNESLSRHQVELGATLDLQFGLGFNGERFYGGLLTNILGVATSAGQDASLGNSVYSIRLFVGYRIPIKFSVPILG